MARRVFFSFHYDDVTRANVVRNSDQITRQYEGAARFYDKSLWEETKKQGTLAIKRMINRGLKGSSVTCVLIGQQTWHRRWVRYEILKSLVRGNGIMGVHIHDVGFSPRDSTNELARLLARQPAATPTAGLLGTDAALAALLPKRPANRPAPPSMGLGALLGGAGSAPAPKQPGPNPLRYLGYTVERGRNFVRVHDTGPNGNWRVSLDVGGVPLHTLPWLPRGTDAAKLSSLFRLYDWKRDNGGHNLPNWIEAAARQVGR